MPVVLPADHVGDVGGDRLVGDEVLRGDGERAHQQHDRRHAGEQVPVPGDKLLRCVLRHQRDDAANEGGNRRIEQRDDETGDEQRDEQPLRLPGEVPVERDKVGRRRVGLRRASRMQRGFKALEEHGGTQRHAPARRRFIRLRSDRAVKEYGGFVAALRVRSMADEAIYTGCNAELPCSSLPCGRSRAAR